MTIETLPCTCCKMIERWQPKSYLLNPDLCRLCFEKGCVPEHLPEPHAARCGRPANFNRYTILEAAAIFEKQEHTKRVAEWLRELSQARRVHDEITYALAKLTRR